MERDVKKSPESSTQKKDVEPERRQSKSEAEPIFSDFDSGRGSGSTPQASDSTPGIEMKTMATSGLPCVPELKIDPAQSDSEVAAGKKSRERSPKKRSPVKAVKEGLRWMRDSLSPPKSPDDGGSRSPKEGGRHSSKSPVRSPVKSMFRRKSRSPTKKEKRRSSELEPFLLGDELRVSSSSSDESQAAAGTSPARETAVKVRHQKRKSKEHAYTKMDAQSCDTEDSSASSEALKASRDRSRKGLRLNLKKEHRKSKECDAAPTTWHDQEEGAKLLPLDAVIGKWSPVRMTTDEEDYTKSPSETDMDLDSLTSGGPDAASAKVVTDETEREVSSTGERISKGLALSDPPDESAEGGPSCLFKRVVLKRQSGVELRDMPDPSPSPKKQPKYGVAKEKVEEAGGKSGSGELVKSESNSESGVDE